MISFVKSGYHGLFLKKYGVGLDAADEHIPFNFISHGHADHVPRKNNVNVFATPPTAAFMKLRGFKGEVQEVDFYDPIETHNAKVTLFPAGHILGSAMIFVETEDGNLLYTGDYRTPPSPATEGFVCPDNVDYLITEATFGLPIYKWKPHDEIFEQMRSFARTSLKDSFTPVFLGYNLGKAQEIMHALAPLSERIQIHGAGFPLCKVYEDAGIDIGNYEKYNRDTVAGSILVAPSSVLDSAMIKNLGKKRVAYCSGWAAHESRRQQMIVDALFPLSDHLDFFELLKLCDQLQPKHTWITHTPNPDVVLHYLNEMGLQASSLDFELQNED